MIKIGYGEMTSESGKRKKKKIVKGVDTVLE